MTCFSPSIFTTRAELLMMLTVLGVCARVCAENGLVLPAESSLVLIV